MELLSGELIQVEEIRPKNVLNSNNIVSPDGIFGTHSKIEESDLVIIPVPWDLTSSNGRGAADGPEAVLRASREVKLYKPEFEIALQRGISSHNIPEKWKETGEELKKIKKRIKSRKQKSNIKINTELINDYKHINYSSLILNEWIEDKCNNYLEKGKFAGILGGEHGVSLGLIKSLSKKYESFSILHIDAHADLIEKHNGFDYSHASFMHNVLKIPQVSKIVQLGIRDFCKEEYVLLSNKKERIKTFSDKYLKEKQFNGIAWSVTCAEIISNLSGNIYISFDIDGLQPHLCPNTQSPVPGGMAFDEICYLISQFSKIGKKIIGFDLCNVTPGRDKDNDWDANVGARILYELSCMTLLTNT